MKINKKQIFILYALMGYLKKINKKFQHKPLEASVSKISFIELLKNLQIVEKSQRGLYKNLETLEKKKLIKYENHFLKLTKKGLKIVKEKDKELFPYLKLNLTLGKKIKIPRTPQTHFK
jgi:hypothetical protein